jgi:MFS family permease
VTATGPVGEKTPSSAEVPRRRFRPRLPGRKISKPLLVVSASVASVQMSWSVVVPVLPAYAADFDLDAAQLGIVVGVFGVGRLLVNLPAGLLAQRVDRRGLLLWSTLTVVLGQVLTGLAVDYPTLLAARLFTGLAGGVAITSGMALLADLTTPENRGRDMSTLQAFQLMGGALGPVVGGLLYTVSDARMTFVLSGLGALVVAGWGYRVLPHASSALPREGLEEAERRPWLSRDVLGVCLLAFAVFFHRFGGMQTLIPLIAYGVAGVSVGSVGLLLGAITVCNILVVRFAGGLSDRVGRKRVIVPAMAVVALGTAGLALSGTTVLFFLATVVAGVAMGFSGPTPAAYLVDVTPRSARGTVTGVYRTFGDLGGILGPVLLGLLVDVAGVIPAALALGGVLAVMTLAFGLLSRETTGPARVVSVLRS